MTQSKFSDLNHKETYEMSVTQCTEKKLSNIAYIHMRHKSDHMISIGCMYYIKVPFRN